MYVPRPDVHKKLFILGTHVVFKYNIQTKSCNIGELRSLPKAKTKGLYKKAICILGNGISFLLNVLIQNYAY